MKDNAKKVLRDRKAAWTLVFLTPLIAELTFGSTPTRFAYLILLWLPIYGAGVLLIRELVVRTGRGWPSIVLLGLAYEIAEDGLGLQALTSANLYHAADWAPQILGFNIAYWVLNVIYHVVFSVVIPIFITNLLFPAFRDRPYLKKGGLVWVTLFALIGVGLLRITVPPAQDPAYDQPLALVIGYVIAIIAIGVIALRVLPRKSIEVRIETTVPSPKKLLLIGMISTIAVFGLMYPFGGAHQPLFTQGAWAYVPIGLGVILAVLAYLTITKWSRAVSWNAKLALALVSGALIGHTLFGLVGAHLELVDRVGLVVMLIVMMWLLWRLYKKLSVDAPMKAA